LANSAEFWPNTTSKVLPYHLGKYAATFLLSNMHWDKKQREYTASHVNAAGFILDKAVDQSNSVSKSTIDR
jgi:hypothetical protein